MEGSTFDRLARAVARSGSRRQVLGAVLAGALGSLWSRTTVADESSSNIGEESGVVIADSSGGNRNAAAAVDLPSGGIDQIRDRDRDDNNDDNNDNDRDPEPEPQPGPDPGPDPEPFEPVCRPGAARFCCQCFDSGEPFLCALDVESAEACADVCDTDDPGDFAVRKARPGHRYRCEDDAVCRSAPC